MQLQFMIVAILLLTLMAAYAIRRAEGEMTEHREVEQRRRDVPPT
jgi:hypothetical protein